MSCNEYLPSHSIFPLLCQWICIQSSAAKPSIWFSCFVFVLFITYEITQSIYMEIIAKQGVAIVACVFSFSSWNWVHKVRENAFMMNAAMRILWILLRHHWGNLYAYTQLFRAYKYIMIFWKLMTFTFKQNNLQNLLGIPYLFLFFSHFRLKFLPFPLKATQRFLNLKKWRLK